jgi:hypothetical protein
VGEYSSFNSIVWILVIEKVASTLYEKLTFNSIVWIPRPPETGPPGELPSFNSIVWIHWRKLPKEHVDGLVVAFNSIVWIQHYS